MPGLLVLASHHPMERTFHAVREKVLPAEPILRVRSAMPGSDRMDRCSQPSNTRCSYTAATHRLLATASGAAWVLCTCRPDVVKEDLPRRDLY